MKKKKYSEPSLKLIMLFSEDILFLSGDETEKGDIFVPGDTMFDPE